MENGFASMLGELTEKLVYKIKTEPAVVAGVLAAVIVWVAGHFGVILDAPTITGVLTPLIVGVLIRFKVTPTAKLDDADKPVEP